MRYPVGIQDFADLRERGCAYVDKTAFVYKLATEPKYYFLSRPRRFGKSLLLSTLRYYFEGRRELFSGLAIEGLEKEWKTYPVIYLDFNSIDTSDDESVLSLINSRLSRYEAKYGRNPADVRPAERLAGLIESIATAEGEKVVLLVDEYDKPLLSVLDDREKADRTRALLKSLYSVVKSEDRYLRFGMLTGVSKFSKVSVFSDLNNLNDISMDPQYATVCGLSEEELRDNFDEGVAGLADKLHIDKESCYDLLRKNYDGYHFDIGTPGVYNPYSIMKTLLKGKFDDYWFENGTPSFLINAMRRTDFNISVDINEPVSSADLKSTDSIDRSAMSILFQTGYLTIKDYDELSDAYWLDYPNEEVRKGFMQNIVPYYTPMTSLDRTLIGNLIRDIRGGRPNEFMERLRIMFLRGGNYMTHRKRYREQDYQNAMYVIFLLLGLHTDVELCTSVGRMGICVQTPDYIYIFELKTDKPVDRALWQMDYKDYASKFTADPRRIYKIAVEFQEDACCIKEYKVV